MDKRVSCRSVLCAAFLMMCFVFAGSGMVRASAEVTLDKTSATVGVGKKVSFSVKGTTKKVKWKSSNVNIAKVSKKGVVKGIAPGKAKIQATVGKKTLTAKVKVRTLMISNTKIDISGEKTVTLTLLTDDGRIKSKIVDSEICSVKIGDWIGNDLPVTVTPKKVGSTKIIFSNTMNDETCVLKVNVKAVPVIAGIEDPVISTGAKDFIPTENTMSVSFTLSQAASDCKVEISSDSGVLIKTINVGNVSANSVNSVQWDGTDNDMKPYEGRYTVAVKTSGVYEKSVNSYTIMQKSPFRAGDGSKEKPFLFGSAEELAMIPRYDGEGVYFRQSTDIDLNGKIDIGELFPSAAGLKGTVSGSLGDQRFAISNYMASRSLFGYISDTGCVSGLTLSDALISGGGSVIAVQNYGTIENCNVNAAISITRSNNLRGGLIAEMNFGSISGCECSGDIKMTLGSVASIVTVRAGGVAAENSGQIYKCNSKVAIGVSVSMAANVAEGSFVYIGGIAGENPEGGIISGANHTGKMTINVGETDNAPTVYQGGVCGVNNGIISGCTFACFDESINQVGFGAGISS